MTQLVDGVLDVKAPEQRIGRHFGGAQDIASAVGLHLGKREQLSQPPVAIAPDPPMDRTHHPIERCAARHAWHDVPRAIGISLGT